MLQYIAAIDPTGGIAQKFYTNPREAENFARAYDEAPYGVYDCVATLRQRSRRRADLGALQLLFWDIDVAHGDLIAEPTEVCAKIATLPTPFGITNSGGGRHVTLELKEPPLDGTRELAHAEELRHRMTTVLAADRACDQSVALLRRPGTRNFKYPEAPLCEVLQPRTPVTLEEANNLIMPLGSDPWFGRGAPDPGLNDRRWVVPEPGEFDTHTALAEMSFEGKVPGRPRPIHDTQWAATKDLMFRRKSVWQTTQIVLRATKDAVRDTVLDPPWDWRREEWRIAYMCHEHVIEYRVLHARLEDRLRIAWQQLEQGGKKPVLVSAPAIGWSVVEEAPAPSPTETPGIEHWLRLVARGVARNATALRLAIYISLAPAARTKGRVQVSLPRAAAALDVDERSLERACSLLIQQGYLRRAQARTSQLTLAYPA